MQQRLIDTVFAQLLLLMQVNKMEYYKIPDYVIAPASINYEYFMVRTEDQQTLGSCVPCAITSDMESIMKRAHLPVVELSKLGAYQDILAAQGTPFTDHGCVPAIAFETMSNVGVGAESLWEYDVNNLEVKAPDAYMADRANHKITSYQTMQLPDDALGRWNLIKGALADHKSVVITIDVQEWFMHIHGELKDQIVNLIGSGYGANSKSMEVRHEIVVDGYRGIAGIIQNQWNGWGDANSMAEIANGFVTAVVTAVVIDGVTGVDARHTVQRENIVMSYIGLFGRAPDHGGLVYWDEHNSTRATVCTSLASYTTDGTDEQFVRQMYRNVTHREADNGGLEFYMHVATEKGRAGMLADFTETALHYTGSDPLGLQSQATFKNLINVAMNVSIDQQCNDVQVCQVALVGITSDAQTVDVAVNNVSHLLG